MIKTWTGWRARAGLAVAGVTLGALVAAAPSVSASTLAGRGTPSASGPVAVTADGAVRGVATGAVDEFLGIPYAAPPVGALRWRPPQPAASWRGVRDATQFAPHCPQSSSPFGQASTSEDCLFLNVFTPSDHKPGSRHAVMVWIHGGALVNGESNDYIPAQLVEDGVTVVPSTTGSARSLSWPTRRSPTRTASRATTASWTSRPRCAGSSATSHASAATRTTSPSSVSPRVACPRCHRLHRRRPEDCSTGRSSRAGPTTSRGIALERRDSR